MSSLPKALGALVLLAATLVQAADTCRPDIETVGVVKTITDVIATHVTSLNVVTIESVTTVPHLCYTHTILGPYVPPKAPSSITSLHCGPVPACAIAKTSTEYRPSHDPCCPTTPTISMASSTTTCQTGCLTIYVATETVTLDSSAYWNPSRTETTSSAHLSVYTTPLAATNADSKLRRVRRAEAEATAAPPPLSVALSSESSVEAESYPCTVSHFYEPSFTEGGSTRTMFPHTVVKTVTLDCVGCKVVEYHGGSGPVVFWGSVTVTDDAVQKSTTFVCRATKSP